MNTIKPSFVKPLWIIRTGLTLLFPPFIFIEFALGGLICYSFSEPGFLAWFIGYIILLCPIVGGASEIYNGTTFEVTHSSVSHNRNFLSSRKKEVLLTNIKEIELKSGVLQKLFGLGTIVIHTQASTVGENRTGISLYDIVNSNEIYEILKKNISKAVKVP